MLDRFAQIALGLLAVGIVALATGTLADEGWLESVGGGLLLLALLLGCLHWLGVSSVKWGLAMAAAVVLGVVIYSALG